jgi:hypothetical protein
MPGKGRFREHTKVLTFLDVDSTRYADSTRNAYHDNVRRRRRGGGMRDECVGNGEPFSHMTIEVTGARSFMVLKSSQSATHTS